MTLLAPLGALGRAVLTFMATVGRVSIFAARALSHIFRPPWYPRELFSSLLTIGWLSLPVVGLTAIFTGGALALQIYAGGARFSAEAVVPQIVAIGMVRELGPVLVGLMIAARVTSSSSVPCQRKTIRRPKGGKPVWRRSSSSRREKAA